MSWLSSSPCRPYWPEGWSNRRLIEGDIPPRTDAVPTEGLLLVPSRHHSPRPSPPPNRLPPSLSCHSLLRPSQLLRQQQLQQEEKQMHQLNEGLTAGDLRMLVDNIFEIDSAHFRLMKIELEPARRDMGSTFPSGLLAQ